MPVKKKTTEEIVTGIIARNFVENEEFIKPNSSFINDLGANELDMISLLQSIEDEFEQEFFDEGTENFETVGQLIDHINSKVSRV
jgi:acyl carrier protein